MARENLHGLPPEIILQIMHQLPDLESLESMIQIFRDARRGLLTRMVPKLYGELMPEAIAAIRSEGLSLTRNMKQAIAVLDDRRRWKEIVDLQKQRENRPDTFVNMGEVMKLLRLHKTVQFFLKDFPEHQRLSQRLLTGENRIDWLDVAFRLSDTETLRLTRALLRIQTYCRIFGKQETRMSGPNPSLLLEYLDPNSGPCPDFGLLPPWKMEEIACVWKYLQEKSSPLINQVRKNLLSLSGLGTGKLNMDQVLERRQFRITDVCDGMDARMPLFIGPMFMYRLAHAKPGHQSTMAVANDPGNSNAREVEAFLINPSLRPGAERLLDPVEKYDVDTVEELESTFTDLERPSVGWMEKIKTWSLAQESAAVPAFIPIWHLDDHFGDDPDWRWGSAIWDEAD
ncbi:hypothetical protein N7492_003386 [Penicillium capsulatum]|uniref:Uncharacterized protein n=1 Tax=Penicillium capsulatum TaxID=69766 RepID=A0A9W9LW21_9EURO|nr:hypothetical protein N7492_003386 [Penicillium capsulatum]KAJ6122031.1 hypothetical protein N7512_004496 [Penicillium capsulatum]